MLSLLRAIYFLQHILVTLVFLINRDRLIPVQTRLSALRTKKF